ncbi:ECM30 (YLR436C) [Zygosaccharomyces parabailii]|nr:ECM30 (YLR436C) [Zygosaccharomyces parabailii]
MGNTDSKLQSLYREHVWQLAGETVPLEENGGFSQFYKDFLAGDNCTVEMFNSLVTPGELQTICQSNQTNVMNLLRFVASSIVTISHSLSTSSNYSLLETQLTDVLVCIRILTKIYPAHLSTTSSDDYFWESTGSDGESGALGYPLVKSLLSLLFVQGFTIPSVGGPGSRTHLLWENGVNTQESTYQVQSARIDSNRLEIVNLLLALCSADLYLEHRNRFLCSLTTFAPEYDVICLMASIINTVCRFCSCAEETSMPYPNFSYKQSQQQHLPALRLQLVSSSLQLLNLMLLHEPHERDELSTLLGYSSPPNNIALSYLATFNREADLRILLTSFAKIFKAPINAAIEQESSLLSFPRKQSSSSITSAATVTTSATTPADAPLIGSRNSRDQDRAGTTYSNNNSNSHNNNNSNASNSNNAGNNSNTIGPPSSSSSSSLPAISPLTLQCIIFFTISVQHNKVFQNYVADKFASKLIVFSVYYLNFYNSTQELSATLIPLCYNLALFFSSKKLVLSKLLETFTPNYYTEKLPNFFKLSTGNINHITYRDFSLIHLCNMAISDVRENLQPRPWLFELIYNLLPIRANLRDEELVQLSSKKRPKSVGNGGLSYNAAMSLLHLLSKMSNKTYLTTYAVPLSGAPFGFYALSPGFKLDLLSLLLRVISVYIVLYFEEAKNLTFALCRHQRILLQIKESIDVISKALNGEVTQPIESLKEVKLSDYFEDNVDGCIFEHDESLRSANDKVDENNGVGPGGGYPGHGLVFNNKKALLLSDDPDAGDADNDRGSVYGKFGNHSNSSTSSNNAHNSTNINHDGEGPESTRGSNIGKSLEVYEHVDFSTNPIMANKRVFDGMRPKWAPGITQKTKAKRRANLRLSDSWTGSHSLLLLLRIARILLRQFPRIATITTQEYYQLLGEIAQFKGQFEETVKPHLSIFISQLSEVQPLQLDISEKNSVYQHWIYMICWANIFNMHSGPYALSQASSITANGSHITNNINTTSGGTNLSRVSSVETMPSIERLNSNGSMLSRTNSNGSSLMGYRSSQRNNENYVSSPLDITNHTISIPKSNASRTGSSNSNGGGSSFLRFAWNGLTKKDNYEPIREEESNVPTSPVGTSSNRPNPFILDTGLLKPNMWTGTKVKLFSVKTEEKEEFSLLDMTSSLLRKFRLNSATSINSSDAINSTSGNSNVYGNGNVKSNGNSLTPISSRPYNPRDSTLMLSTPKKN